MEQIVIFRSNQSFLLNSIDPIISVETAEQKKELLGINEVYLKIKTVSPIDLRIGDYTVIFGEKYTINRLPNPTKLGTRNFEYNVTLESVQYDLLRCILLNQDVSGFSTSPTFTLTGDLSLFCGVIQNNANRVFSGQWSFASLPSSTDKTITFDKDNCLSALQTICKQFEVEFRIVENGNNKTIHIGSIGIVIPTVFEHGQGRGLYTLSRETLNDKNIVNRLYLFGGSTNIPSNYRDYSQNLKIEGDCIEASDSITAFGLIEGVKEFEDIFPKRLGSVSSVNGQLEFTDSSMDFDLNSSLVEGVSAKLTFNSGGLAGYSFEIKSYLHATKTFTLIAFTDERGFVLPSATLSAFQISAGDEYVLTDINLPSQYITNAENLLRSKGQDYLDQNKNPRIQYGLTFDENYFKDLYENDVISNVFDTGDYVQVLDSDMNIDGATRITGITRNILYPYRYALTIADSYEVTLIERIISEGKTTSTIIKLNKLYDATKAKIGWRNTQELLTMVFDTDGFFDMGNIKPLSVTTAMVEVGVKSQQFVLKMVIEPNYQGQKNTVKVNSGVLAHYAIEETIRTWQIAQDTITLPNDNAYYIYAKCNKSNYNEAIILLSESQIKVDDVAGYYVFLVGVLHSVDNNVRWISLTYGSTTINGRFIRTGRIQSALGETYFDLDSGEIQGKIKFLDEEGNAIDVDTLNQELASFGDVMNEFINTTYPSDLQAIGESFNSTQTQIDGKIESYFQTTDPNTWAESERLKHTGDMWYKLDDKKLFRYNGTTNTWQRIEDKDALDAFEAASKAQDTADGKRRVFTAEPYPPYDVGDLWTDGSHLRRCVTPRLTGSYNPLDWNFATFYDNTVTTINGGIVTSGRIQLAGDDFNIKAGITGNGTADDSVRFWAGTSYENRAIAPCRILQSGKAFFREAVILTNEYNQEQGGICGDAGSTTDGVRAFFGSTYSSRNIAPCRIYSDGTFVATKGTFGVLTIDNQRLINQGFDSEAYLALRRDSEGSLALFGTNVYSVITGAKGSLRTSQSGYNDIGWNIGSEFSASGSTIRNVACYIPDGELLANKVTFNGQSMYEATLNDQNLTVDTSLFNMVVINPTGSAPSGVTLSGTVNEGKEITIFNFNPAKSMYIYNSIRGYPSVEINGGEIVKCIKYGAYWYISSRHDNNF